MKIKYAIMSSDSNPLYLDFWPIVSKVWKEKFDIEPILYYIDENHDIDITEEFGKVIKLKPIEDIPIYLQCLWVRYWSFSQYPNDVCILSDIDMIPLSRYYFIRQLENIEEEKYVHINPMYNEGILPSCYHICKGEKFKNILGLHETFEDSVRYIYELNEGTDPGGYLSGNNHWFSDERVSHKKIIEYKQKYPNEIIFITRNGGQNGHRIDRLNWKYDVNLLKKEYYYDSHSIRPYSNYKSEIDNLINVIL